MPPRYALRDDQWERIKDLLPGAKSGVWKRIFEHLACDADNEYAMIDSTIVRAHQHTAGAPGAAAAD